jgi:predicted RNA-binding Zn ribbon-like protein
MQPDGHPDKQAPGELQLIQSFVNTVDFESGEDELASPESLHAWLSERELMPAGMAAGEAELCRAVDVREGLRALLLANNGNPLDTAAVDRLNRGASRAGLVIRADRHGNPVLEPDASGVDAAMARLMAIVAHAKADGTWSRLKACPRESCLWAFYDSSKNRSGKWCRMEECGNVEKARRHRRRHKAPTAPSP